jgi:hypothetical protein
MLKDDPPFYSLIMAAMQKADTENICKLRTAFPEVWAELEKRYNAPMGVIPEDGKIDMDVLAVRIHEMEEK